jgi:hypothetical protein
VRSQIDPSFCLGDDEVGARGGGEEAGDKEEEEGGATERRQRRRHLPAARSRLGDEMWEETL